MHMLQNRKKMLAEFRVQYITPV